MSKDELERYSKRFVWLGIILIVVGVLNWMRSAREGKWFWISTAGCAAVGLMQFMLAYRLHQKAQSTRE